MSRLDDLLLKLDYVEFPRAGMRKLAEERGIQTVDELDQFIKAELLICEVGDRLPTEARQLGRESRREMAIHILKQTGRIPVDYK